MKIKFLARLRRDRDRRRDRSQALDRITSWLRHHPDSTAAQIAIATDLRIVTAMGLLDDLTDQGTVSAHWTPGPPCRLRLYRIKAVADAPSAARVPEHPAASEESAATPAAAQAPAPGVLPRRPLPPRPEPGASCAHPSDTERILGWLRVHPGRNAAAIADGTGIPVGRTLTVLGTLDDSGRVTSHRIATPAGHRRLYRLPGALPARSAAAEPDPELRPAHP